MTLPAPGTLLVYDYRPTPHAQWTAPTPTRPLRVLQWNIERNYQADLIIQEIRAIDPDIAFLQEIDIGCKRSGARDHLHEMASALQMRAGFVCEFEEFESVVRSPRDQGGGVHGNAIFTKMDAEFRVLEHTHHPVDWEREGMALREPRKGERYTIVAEVKVLPDEPPILCYSAHLEVFCGIAGRIAQFSDILADAAAHRHTHPRQLLCGDLNTMAHSIARLSKRYCRDGYRWRSIGYTEAQWWDQKLLAWHCEDGPRNEILAKEGVFSEKVLHAARNPGFWDPWDVVQDITLQHASYGGIYKGKLDWTLLLGWELEAKRMGNHTYAASDHKWLVVELLPEKDDELGDSGAHVAQGIGADAATAGIVESTGCGHPSGPSSSEVSVLSRQDASQIACAICRTKSRLTRFRQRRDAVRPRDANIGLRVFAGLAVTIAVVSFLIN